MAHVLRITDSTSTVTFTSGDMYLAEYVPQVATDVFTPIKERLTVGFTTSIATITSNIQSINRLLYQAQSYDRNRSGARVYVEFDPGTSGTVYRSLLYGGSVHPTDDFLGSQWGSGKIEFEIEWTRDPFWEGPVTAVPLSNASDTDNTSGIAVNNRGDASGENWVSISATDVAGDLPAPIRLWITHNSTDANNAGDFYIFHNVYANPSSFVHIIEAESSTDSHVTSTTDSTCSSNAYAAIAWDSTSETKIAEWTLASSDISDAASERFALLLRWNGLFPLTDCWIRPKIETRTYYYDVWVGNLSLVSATTDGDELTLLDTVRLPPYLVEQANLGELALTLYGLRNSTDNDISLDYIQLSPISGDTGWLHLKAVTRGLGPGEKVVYDGTEGFTYRYENLTKFGDITQYGGPLLLVPNEAQKLYFLTADYTGLALPSQNWTVRMWYRARRFVL